MAWWIPVAAMVGGTMLQQHGARQQQQAASDNVADVMDTARRRDERHRQRQDQLLGDALESTALGREQVEDAMRDRAAGVSERIEGMRGLRDEWGRDEQIADEAPRQELARQQKERWDGMDFGVDRIAPENLEDGLAGAEDDQRLSEVLAKQGGAPAPMETPQAEYTSSPFGGETGQAALQGAARQEQDALAEDREQIHANILDRDQAFAADAQDRSDALAAQHQGVMDAYARGTDRLSGHQPVDFRDYYSDWGERPASGHATGAAAYDWEPLADDRAGARAHLGSLGSVLTRNQLDRQPYQQRMDVNDRTAQMHADRLPLETQMAQQRAMGEGQPWMTLGSMVQMAGMGYASGGVGGAMAGAGAGGYQGYQGYQLGYNNRLPTGSG